MRGKNDSYDIKNCHETRNEEIREIYDVILQKIDVVDTKFLMTQRNV